MLQRTPSPAFVPSSERTSRTEDHLRHPQTAELKHRPTMSSQHCGVFSHEPADLFSAGSCWWGWASTAPQERAGLLPWGGTAAGLQSAYHGRRTPRRPERRREGKRSRLQSRDKPLSCWENQRPSLPEGGKRSLTHTSDKTAFTKLHKNNSNTLTKNVNV